MDIVMSKTDKSEYDRLMAEAYRLLQSIEKDHHRPISGRYYLSSELVGQAMDIKRKYYGKENDT